MGTIPNSLVARIWKQQQNKIPSLTRIQQVGQYVAPSLCMAVPQNQIHIMKPCQNNRVWIKKKTNSSLWAKGTIYRKQYRMNQKANHAMWEMYLIIVKLLVITKSNMYTESEEIMRKKMQISKIVTLKIFFKNCFLHSTKDCTVWYEGKKVMIWYEVKEGR